MNRIKLARKLRGLSMDQLVKNMEGAVSKMAISKYERGLMEPSARVLDAIGCACGLPIDFFTKPSLGYNTMSFRIDKDGVADVDEYFLTQVTDRIEEYIEAEVLAGAEIAFENPLTGRTISTYEDAEIAAKELRHVLEIGAQPIVSVYEMIELMGVKIIEFCIADEKYDGVSLYVNGEIPCMLINTYKNKTVERKRFTALHELAHLLLGMAPSEDENYLHSVHRRPTAESLANRFAGAMLMPPDVLYKRIGKKRDDIILEELISIKNLYGISISSLCYRLYDLGVITLEYRNQLYNDTIRNNYMETGWGGYPLPETSDRIELIGYRNRDYKKINPSEEGS